MAVTCWPHAEHSGNTGTQRALLAACLGWRWQDRQQPARWMPYRQNEPGLLVERSASRASTCQGADSSAEGVPVPPTELPEALPPAPPVPPTDAPLDVPVLVVPACKAAELSPCMRACRGSSWHCGAPPVWMMTPLVVVVLGGVLEVGELVTPGVLGELGELTGDAGGGLHTGGVSAACRRAHAKARLAA